MRTVRLLPIVVMAGLALLVLKSVGLFTGGGYVLTGVELTGAQEAGSGGISAAPAPGAEGQPFTPEAIAAANKASESLFSRAAPAPVDSRQLDAVPYRQNKAGEKVVIGSGGGLADTEKAVLERLGDRRTELEQMAAELELRAQLVAAAEQRLAERAAGLQALEARISALVEEKKSQDDTQFAGLVGMYETMKPKDAAEIFNQLDMNVLLRVAVAMNPRKMAPVLAAMAPARAKDLTAAMALERTEPALTEPVDDFSQLPQIVGN